MSDDYVELGEFLLGAMQRHHREEGSTMNEIATIGHNRGTTIDFAREAMNTVSHWLRDNPVIATPDEARDANDVLTSALLTLKDLDDQRKEQTEPLNRQLTAINSLYRSVRVPFDNAVAELRRRLTNYVAGEEAKRAAEAARLRAEAEAKEQAAREAERKEQDAIACAEVGECTDVGAAIEEAEAEFSAFTAAERAATIAEHDVPVRLRSRFGGKARTLRTTEVFEVTNAVAAIQAIVAAGAISEKLADAIIYDAKFYRKDKGSLPPGIVAKHLRSL